MKNYNNVTEDCKKFLMGINDTMDIIGGKWQLYIIASLYNESRRYSEILKELSGISGRILSMELKNMEMNHIIRRRNIEAQPQTFSYELTDYGQTLKPVIHLISDWGIEHRREIVGRL
ncbi:putative HTH-type transcriptional regulator YtcD [Chryseobacterium sp. MOF25P]|uniref:winged helix-turn-helix transcriptional regulator n=1 Tax=unclassified Chryseobacterium TaxID=2593645 RepID=UPI000804FCD8|nr:MULTISPECIES: helix-turn-helix domain-containing protein [unclassified Chryseobacterium]OBW43347.1 putative HTH-type transcriptional regulator YtcD [Chryseobacterium sp. MOF25P]OBW46995.1 putative HTH-type transcriptional regulator YtcD [Chryseobacterium sp. BGARF1]